MAIDEIAIAWFRGAADRIALPADRKSVVVHGPNGSGKSCFVDGVEYLLSGGRIGHLAHQYSGRRQEKGVINIAAGPTANRYVELRINGSSVRAEIAADGAVTITGHDLIAGWDAARIILRQDELAEFIRADKSVKYSVLLPLIGLDPLENVATNLRGLARKVRDGSGVERAKGELAYLEQQRRRAFGDLPNTAVWAKIKDLHRKYLPDHPEPERLGIAVEAVRAALNRRIGNQEAESATHVAIKTAAEAQLRERLEQARVAAERAAAIAEPLLDERLTVLQSASAFVAKLEDDGTVPCPACGQDIGARDFKVHVEEEKRRLEQALSTFAECKRCLATLADAIFAVQRALSRKEVRAWRDDPAQGDVRPYLEALLNFDAETLRTRGSTADLAALREIILPVAKRLDEAATRVPPIVRELVEDLALVDAASGLPAISALRRRVGEVEGLLTFLSSAEDQTRDEIRARTSAVIAEISSDMQRMWSVLHPGELIDEVRLYQADGVDRAIDIALRFHGRDQPSPRLVLSEGHRNSLGLCVFLALAKRDGTDKPLILDDVVCSFDREHRAFVTDLLQAEFPDRQVILFTHDYEWFTELLHRLPRNQWGVRLLLPWKEPSVGIRWATKVEGFDTARDMLDKSPSTAAASARTLMDIHMAVIAERLQISVPFIRGPRNDLRHAADLLERLMGQIGKRLRRRDDSGTHVPWDGPKAAATEAHGLLIPWGNAGTHGRYITRPEAERLIDACEAVLHGLTCTTCETAVWYATVGDDHLQCSCGTLRWKLR